MAEISHDAQKLVDQWMQAHEHKLRAQLALERAQAEEQQAANVLAAVMCPKDMGPGEVVTTWARINRTLTSGSSTLGVYDREPARIL